MPPGLHHRRQHQVLLDVQAREDAALLRAVGEAQPGDLVGRLADRLAALEGDRAGALLDDAHDRLQRRRLAGAVAAQQRHQLAAADLEAHAVQDVRFAVPGLQAVDLEQCSQRMTRPDIGFDHGGILRHRAYGPSASTSPRASTVMVSREVGDHGHVVLDHQHGAVAGDGADQRGDALDVLLPQARHRLVQQHHLGIERQRGGDLQRPLAAIGQVDGLLLGEGREADGVDQLHGAAVELVQHALGRQNWKELPSLRCRATRTFSRTERCGKTAEIWNERASPMRAIAAGELPVMLRALEVDLPARRRQEMREQVEAGRLARAIRPDQRVDCVAPHAQIDVLDRDEALELLRQPFRLENYFFFGHPPPCGVAN